LYNSSKQLPLASRLLLLASIFEGDTPMIGVLFWTTIIVMVVLTVEIVHTKQR
jgi:hypothetical protein